MRAIALLPGMRIAWGGARWDIIRTEHTVDLVTLWVHDVPFHEVGDIPLDPDEDIEVTS